jgi:hypothetical protein
LRKRPSTLRPNDVSGCAQTNKQNELFVDSTLLSCARRAAERRHIAPRMSGRSERKEGQIGLYESLIRFRYP